MVIFVGQGKQEWYYCTYDCVGYRTVVKVYDYVLVLSCRHCSKLCSAQQSVRGHKREGCLSFMTPATVLPAIVPS